MIDTSLLVQAMSRRAQSLLELTEAKLALSLWADPDVNGVRWKGESLP